MTALSKNRNGLVFLDSIEKAGLLALTKIHTPPPLSLSLSPTQQSIGKFIVQDGNAFDTQTGLMWCRFAHGQTWQNDTAIGDAEEVDWQTAFDVAENFNRQGGYAGYTDWRLPTIGELEGLIYLIKGKDGNYIDADVFPNNYTHFWSSSPNDDPIYYAWVVDFEEEAAGCCFMGYSSAVRLVRGRTVIF